MSVNIYAPFLDDGVEPAEQQLYDLVNQYRIQNGLPAIPISAALTLVANRHVHDLAENIGKLTHGWSDAPYDANNSATYYAVWTAPQRFNTGYPGNGYENAYWNSGGATAENSLTWWKNSPGHNALLLNLGIWQRSHWNSIGLGIYGQYAVLWVGEEADTTLQFNGLNYIASYGDLINAFGLNSTAATQHYITNGYAEHRSVSFNGLNYIASYGDLIDAFGLNSTAATQHYITNGYAEHRNVSFNGLNYIASYGDLIDAFGLDSTAATQHYITNGYAEHRNVSFNGLNYIASYGDLIGAFGLNSIAATQHYISSGYAEGRSVNFNAEFYLAKYTDLRTAFGIDQTAATQHFITGGYTEGRTGSNADDDNLIGSVFNDNLNAGAGNDIIDSGLGSDVLTGGTGMDIFKFTNLGSFDRITDFVVVDDTIQLENAVFTSLTTTGVLNAANFVTGIVAADADDYLVYNSGTGAFFYDTDGKGVGAAVQIVLLGTGLALTNADFVVI